MAGRVSNDTTDKEQLNLHDDYSQGIGQDERQLNEHVCHFAKCYFQCRNVHNNFLNAKELPRAMIAIYNVTDNDDDFQAKLA